MFGVPPRRGIGGPHGKRGLYRLRRKESVQYSVLMAVYWRENPEYFRQAITSMLQQTVPPDDFVIVCDGELNQPLYDVIDGFCREHPGLFQVLKLEKNSGLGTALREGLKLCRCDLVARMDTDDLSVPDRMEKQLEAFRSNPRVSVVGGQISEFQEDPTQIIDYRIVPSTCEKIRRRAAFRNPMNHVTAVFRKAHVEAVGSYVDIPGFEDYHLWSRMLSEGYCLMNIDHICCNVRVDINMYGRRSGWDYFRRTVRMERFLLDRKLVGPVGFALNVAVRFLGTVICPDGLKGFFFKVFMRKKKLPVRVDAA